MILDSTFIIETNKILILLLAIILGFGLTTLLRKFLDVPVLIAVAIGCAVNANLFNAFNKPIFMGPIIFGIDSILFTLFIYTVIVRALDYGHKEAKSLALTSVAAILISGAIELFANWSGSGSLTWEMGKVFLRYVFSSIGTIAGTWLTLFIFNLLKKRNCNVYLMIFIGIVTLSIENSLIYFCGNALLELKATENLGYILLGSVIGKITCSAVAILCYWINIKFRKPKNLINNIEKSE